jgi:hypothetical protein
VSKAGFFKVLSSLLLVLEVFEIGCRRMPPDLSACTRIEIHYPYGGLGYFFHDAPMQKGILTHEEEEYARACEAWAVEDHEMIRTFARDISRATYRGRVRGRLPPSSVSLVCYSGAERIASFTIFSNDVVTQDGLQFKCPPGLPNLRLLEPPRIRLLRLRYLCATQLRGLYTSGFLRPGEATSYPDPNRWCDAVVGILRNEYRIDLDKGGLRERSHSDATIAEMFVCPSAHPPTSRKPRSSRTSDTKPPDEPTGQWQSDYAMNSKCKRDALADTVLLFEARAGWNQHGGPELFTFDNHDPRGGLVLLNDGTVKFIRTEEELKQLRWK